jgi:hypothetical protein
MATANGGQFASLWQLLLATRRARLCIVVFGGGHRVGAR